MMTSDNIKEIMSLLRCPLRHDGSIPESPVFLPLLDITNHDGDLEDGAKDELRQKIRVARNIAYDVKLLDARIKSLDFLEQNQSTKNFIDSVNEPVFGFSLIKDSKKKINERTMYDFEPAVTMAALAIFLRVRENNRQPDPNFQVDVAYVNAVNKYLSSRTEAQLQAAQKNLNQFIANPDEFSNPEIRPETLEMFKELCVHLLPQAARLIGVIPNLKGFIADYISAQNKPTGAKGVDIKSATEDTALQRAQQLAQEKAALTAEKAQDKQLIQQLNANDVQQKAAIADLQKNIQHLIAQVKQMQQTQQAESKTLKDVPLGGLPQANQQLKQTLSQSTSSSASLSASSASSLSSSAPSSASSSAASLSSSSASSTSSSTPSVVSGSAPSASSSATSTLVAPPSTSPAPITSGPQITLSSSSTPQSQLQTQLTTAQAQLGGIGAVAGSLMSSLLPSSLSSSMAGPVSSAASSYMSMASSQANQMASTVVSSLSTSQQTSASQPAQSTSASQGVPPEVAFDYRAAQAAAKARRRAQLAAAASAASSTSSSTNSNTSNSQ